MSQRSYHEGWKWYNTRTKIDQIKRFIAAWNISTTHKKWFKTLPMMKKTKKEFEASINPQIKVPCYIYVVSCLNRFWKDSHWSRLMEHIDYVCFLRPYMIWGKHGSRHLSINSIIWNCMLIQQAYWLITKWWIVGLLKNIFNCNIQFKHCIYRNFISYISST